MASRPELKQKVNKPIIQRSSRSHRKSISHVRSMNKSKKDADPALLLMLGKTIRSLETRIETEEKKSKETKDVSVLGSSLVAEFMPTPRSMPMQTAVRSMFRDRVYPFRISTALNMSSSSGGIVNSTINMAVVQSSAEYTALSAIFEEFFIIKADVHWEPVSEYNFPLSGLPDGKTVATLPIGCATLVDLAPVYSSLTSLLNNFNPKMTNTGIPFQYSWINPISRNTTVLSTTSTTGTWCSTTSGQTYTGAIQFMSQAAPPGLPVSSVLGTFAVHFDLLFRVRQ